MTSCDYETVPPSVEAYETTPSVGTNLKYTRLRVALQMYDWPTPRWVEIDKTCEQLVRQADELSVVPAQTHN